MPRSVTLSAKFVMCWQNKASEFAPKMPVRSSSGKCFLTALFGGIVLIPASSCSVTVQVQAAAEKACEGSTA